MTVFRRALTLIALLVALSCVTLGPSQDGRPTPPSLWAFIKQAFQQAYHTTGVIPHVEGSRRTPDLVGHAFATGQLHGEFLLAFLDQSLRDHSLKIEPSAESNTLWQFVVRSRGAVLPDRPCEQLTIMFVVTTAPEGASIVCVVSGDYEYAWWCRPGIASRRIDRDAMTDFAKRLTRELRHYLKDHVSLDTPP